jgi:hypothetical protein
MGEITLLLKSFVKRNLQSNAHASGKRSIKSGLNHPHVAACKLFLTDTDRTSQQDNVPRQQADTTYSGACVIVYSVYVYALKSSIVC